MIPCVCATLKLRSWGLCGCRVDNSVGSSVSIAQRACRCYLGAFSPVVQVWQCVAIMIHPTSSIYQPLYRWSTKQRVQLPYSISSRTVSQYVDRLCFLSDGNEVRRIYYTASQHRVLVSYISIVSETFRDGVRCYGDRNGEVQLNSHIIYCCTSKHVY